MTIRSTAKRPCRLLVLALLSIPAVGCDQSSRSLSLDQPQARDACETFLKAWQSGRKPEDLKPEIIGSDYDWQAGRKLVSFEILPDETSDGTNLHIPVRLTLQDAKGSESRSDAVYTVGTSPVVTVIRK